MPFPPQLFPYSPPEVSPSEMALAIIERRLFPLNLLVMNSPRPGLNSSSLFRTPLAVHSFPLHPVIVEKGGKFATLPLSFPSLVNGPAYSMKEKWPGFPPLPSFPSSPVRREALLVHFFSLYFVWRTTDAQIFFPKLQLLGSCDSPLRVI